MRNLILATALVLGGLILVPQASAQSCRVLKTCPAAPAPAKTRRKPPQANPPKPAQVSRQPTASRCDLLWSSVGPTGYRVDLAAFVSQCPRHARVGEAEARIASIDSERAAHDRQCESRLETLAGSTNAASATLSAFAADCPLAAGKATFMMLRERVSMRERVETEGRRWGLTYRDICSLRGKEFLAKVNLPARRLDVNLAANNGDSVANLILGLDAYFDFASGNRKYEDSIAHFYAAAKAGNPRGLAEHATILLADVEPDFSAIDAMLMRSRAMGCGRASYIMAIRHYPWEGKPQPTPKWDANLTGPFLFREAVAAGVGIAACRLVTSSYDEKLARWTIGRAEREALYRDAGLAGSRCGEIALIQEGSRTYSGGTPFGPCATDNYNCMRSRLRQLRDQKVAEAGLTLYGYLTSKSVGGTGSASPEAFAAVEQDAKMGDSAAMAWAGVLQFKGEGTAPDAGRALDWCYRSAVQGSAFGTACAGILSKDGRSFIQMAARRDPCAPYRAAAAMLPTAQGRSATDLAAAVKALSRARKAALQSILPNIRLAFAESGKSVGKCGADAKTSRSIVDEYVAPHL